MSVHNCGRRYYSHNGKSRVEIYLHKRLHALTSNQRDQITRLHSRVYKCARYGLPFVPSLSILLSSLIYFYEPNLLDEMVAKLEQVAQNKAFGGSITKYKFKVGGLGYGDEIPIFL